jgi:hypothetical protein
MSDFQKAYFGTRISEELPEDDSELLFWRIDLDEILERINKARR